MIIKNSDMNRWCPLCSSLGHKVKVTKNGFKIVECVACSFVYVLNPKATTISSLNKEINIDSYKLRHVQVINQINLEFNDASKVIKIADIGAGYGHLAKLMLKEENYNYQGFEPSIERAEFCQKKGLNVCNKLFTISDDRYDVIIMDNVLEHVSNPIEIIDSIEKSLKNSGIFICIVPNVFDLRQMSKVWKDIHHWQPNCHINYFSYADLKRISSRFNMTLKSFSYRSLPDGSSVTNKIKTLLDNMGPHVGGLYTYFVKK
jgi:SAM-dependent methyltransferase